MQYRYYLGKLWLILSSFGICFALLSSFEEVMQGKYWKAIAALILGIFIYLTLGINKKEEK